MSPTDHSPSTTHQATALYIGCYTAETGGDLAGDFTGLGNGLAVARRDPGTGALGPAVLVAKTPAPSYVARHPTAPVLYAVNEVDEGQLTAFRVHPDHTLTELGSWSTGGALPCHLAVAARHLFVANYGSGSVAVFALAADGLPTHRSDLVAHHGAGAHPVRQAGPHAHSVAPTADGVLVLDLGVDTVFRYRFDPATGRLGPGEVAVRAQPGTGPRHLVTTGPDALHLVGELAATVTSYARTGDGWHEVGRAGTSVVPGAAPSEIAASADGRFLYIANRGPDTIAVFSRTGGAGAPELVGEVATGGSWPRHFVLVGRFLYVANERSHTVVAFTVDPGTGLPGPTGDVLSTPSPSCLLPWV